MTYLPKLSSVRGVLGAAVVLALPLLAGCGGGGDASPITGGGSSSASAVLVTGQVQSPTGGSVSGDRVVLNLGSPRSTTARTDAQGQFTLSVPQTWVTGHDTISIMDASGSLLASVPVTLVSGATVALPPITVGPPAPPGGV